MVTRQVQQVNERVKDFARQNQLSTITSKGRTFLIGQRGIQLGRQRNLPYANPDGSKFNEFGRLVQKANTTQIQQRTTLSSLVNQPRPQPVSTSSLKRLPALSVQEVRAVQIKKIQDAEVKQQEKLNTQQANKELAKRLLKDNPFLGAIGGLTSGIGNALTGALITQGKSPNNANARKRLENEVLIPGLVKIIEEQKAQGGVKPLDLKLAVTDPNKNSLLKQIFIDNPKLTKSIILDNPVSSTGLFALGGAALGAGGVAIAGSGKVVSAGRTVKSLPVISQSLKAVQVVGRIPSKIPGLKTISKNAALIVGAGTALGFEGAKVIELKDKGASNERIIGDIVSDVTRLAALGAGISGGVKGEKARIASKIAKETEITQTGFITDELKIVSRPKTGKEVLLTRGGKVEGEFLQTSPRFSGSGDLGLIRQRGTFQTTSASTEVAEIKVIESAKEPINLLTGEKEVFKIIVKGKELETGLIAEKLRKIKTVNQVTSLIKNPVTQFRKGNVFSQRTINTITEQVGTGTGKKLQFINRGQTLAPEGERIAAESSSNVFSQIIKVNEDTAISLSVSKGKDADAIVATIIKKTDDWTIYVSKGRAGKGEKLTGVVLRPSSLKEETIVRTAFTNRAKGIVQFESGTITRSELNTLLKNTKTTIISKSKGTRTVSKINKFDARVKDSIKQSGEFIATSGKDGTATLSLSKISSASKTGNLVKLSQKDLQGLQTSVGSLTGGITRVIPRTAPLFTGSIIVPTNARGITQVEIRTEEITTGGLQSLSQVQILSPAEPGIKTRRVLQPEVGVGTSKFIQETREKLKVAGVSEFLTEQARILTPDTTLKLASVPATIPAVITKSVTDQITEIGITETVVSIPPGIPFASLFPFGLFPFLGKPGFTRKKKTRRKLVRKKVSPKKFKPSLAGIIHNVKIKKAPSFVTGIGIRGVVVAPKKIPVIKRKKKRIKKKKRNRRSKK